MESDTVVNIANHGAESKVVIVTDIVGHGTEVEVNVVTNTVSHGTEEEVDVTKIVRYAPNRKQPPSLLQYFTAPNRK